MTYSTLRLALLGLSLAFGCQAAPNATSATDPSTSDDTLGGSASATHITTSSGGPSTSGTTGGESSTGRTTAADTDTGATTRVGSTGESTGESTTTTSSTTGDAPLVGCHETWPETGSVQGQTPIGALAFKYAAFDPDGCDALNSIGLYLFPEMPALVQDIDIAPNPVRLDVELVGPGWYGNWISEGPVHVRLVDESQAILAEADGTLHVTMLDVLDTSYLFDGGLPHWLVGELHVVAPGWALHGGFTAAICWMINGITLCP